MAVQRSLTTTAADGAILHPEMETGARSRRIVAAVAYATPGAKHVVLHGQGHDAHVRAPEQLARVIEAHADSVLQLGRN